MTPAREPGRWYSAERKSWHCNGVSPDTRGAPCFLHHGFDMPYCEACGSVRPPMPEAEPPRELRERVVALLRAAHISTRASTFYELAETLGLAYPATEFQIADALLAAGSRPTGEGAEREAWIELMNLIDEYGYACAKVALRRISPLDENAARDRLNAALTAALRPSRPAPRETLSYSEIPNNCAPTPEIESLLATIEKQGDKAYHEGHYTIGLRIRATPRCSLATTWGASGATQTRISNSPRARR